MDLPENSIELHEIQDKIIETDEIIKLLEAKKKEVNKANKRYKLILDKFCAKNKELINLNSSVVKKQTELRTENEVSEKNHNKYVNDAEKKYQLACQEIKTLNEECENLRKNLKKIDHKDKTRNNVKKIQDALNEAKEQLKDSLCKYNLLEITSNKTISDLKEKYNGLEQRHNETLKQVAKLRIECDSLRKSQENCSSLRQEIEELETKVESAEIELDILKQSQETDIAELKKQYETEKKLLENELETYKNEERIKRNEKQTLESSSNDRYKNQINLLEDQLRKLNDRNTELINRHENEKKILNAGYINETKLLTKRLEELNTQDKKKNVEIQNDKVAELTKKFEDEKQAIEEQLGELKKQITQETKNTEETRSTQTEDEDIYNLEDIFTDMRNVTKLISPLSFENEEIVIKCSVAVGNDDIMPTFTDSFTQICTKDFLSLSDASTQINSEQIHQNTIKVRTLEQIDQIKCLNSSTQTDNSPNIHQSEIEFKFQPSIIKIPENNIFEKIAKNVLLKSRITKKYKNIQKNNVLNSLKNSKLDLKFLFEKSLDNSRRIYVSSSILKSDKIKMNDLYNTSNTNYNFPFSNSAQFPNSIPCSCQLSMCWNRYVPVCPCNYNHNMNCNNNRNNYCNMKKSKDFDDNNSEIDEDCLRKALKKYKQKIKKKKINEILDDSEDDDIFDLLYSVMKKSKRVSKKREKTKSKSTNCKRVILSSDSEQEIVTIKKNNTIHKETNFNTDSTFTNFGNNHNFDTVMKEKEQNEKKQKCSSMILEKEQNTNKPKVKSNASLDTGIKSNLKNNCKEIESNSGKNKNLFKRSNETSKRIEEDERDSQEAPPTNINSRTDFGKLQETNTNLFTLSKRQRSLLRKSSLLRGNTLVNSSCKKISNKSITPHSNAETSKRKASCVAGNDYKKQKLELFGDTSDSDSNTEDDSEIIKNPLDFKNSTCVKNCDKVIKNVGPLAVSNYLQNNDEVIQNILDDHSYITNEKSEANNPKNSSGDSNLATLSTSIVYKKPERSKLSLPFCKEKTDKKKCEAICLALSNNVQNNEELKQNLIDDNSYSLIKPSRVARVTSEKLETNKQKTSTGDANLATSTSEIFKNPGRSKLDLSSCKAKKNEKKFQEISVNVLTDSPDVKYITHNAVERPLLTDTKTEHIEKLPSVKLVTDKTLNVLSDVPYIYSDKKLVITASNNWSDLTEISKCFNAKKNEKECGRNTVDSADVDYITYNTVERPLLTKKETEHTGKLHSFDLEIAKKFIRDVASNDWDKDLVLTTSKYLADKDPAIVGILIVNQAASDFSQTFDKSFTPPAPLLTTCQQKILVLLDQLEKQNLRNIYPIFLQVLERRMLSENRLEIVHSLIRLYVTACKLKYDIEKIRMFCCNAAYYMGDLILPVMFIVLTTWGDVLPMAANAEDIPLAAAIVHVIQLKTCKKPGYNCLNLNRLLADYYGYKRGERSNDEMFSKLIHIYLGTYSNTACTAIIILCKNLPNDWTYTKIKNSLIPLVGNCEIHENKMKTVSLIQRLTDNFDKINEQGCIIEIKKLLSNYTLNT